MSRRMAGQLYIIVIALIALAWMPVAAQGNFRDVIEMSVEVGFDTFFRPGLWTPVTISLKNNGESVVGRLVIRPGDFGDSRRQRFQHRDRLAQRLGKVCPAEYKGAVLPR